ncbi:MAG: hypothetical protein ACM31C_30865, partial [Acidobacteriota bacterium]
FAQEIERELRMLEEYVMSDEPSDDVGENLIVRDDGFEPPEVPFQPKPTSVSVAALADRGTHTGSQAEDHANDFASDSNFTTMPKVDRQPDTPTPADDIHAAPTMILDQRRVRRSSQREAQQKAAAARPRKTSVPPPPPPAAGKKKSGVRPIYDEDLHAAPTMIIDIGRMRQRQRR